MANIASKLRKARQGAPQIKSNSMKNR